MTVLQLPAAIAGMAGVVFLLQRFPKNALLTRIGYYSYTIYLWHVMAGAAMRGVLMHAGVTSIPMLFLFSLTAGVVTPIIMYEAARRVPASQRRCAPCRQTASLWRNSECAAS